MKVFLLKWVFNAAFNQIILMIKYQCHCIDMTIETSSWPNALIFLMCAFMNIIGAHPGITLIVNVVMVPFLII